MVSRRVTRLAGDLPVLRVLQRHVGRRRAAAGGVGHLAVASWCGPMGPWVMTLLAARHSPTGTFHSSAAACTSIMPRGGAALAHVLLRLADAAAAAGGEVAPDAVARQVLARRGVLGADLGPVAVQLLGHQLRQPGQRALAHLGARDADDHACRRAAPRTQALTSGGGGGRALRGGPPAQRRRGSRPPGRPAAAPMPRKAAARECRVCCVMARSLTLSSARAAPAACLMPARTRL